MWSRLCPTLCFTELVSRKKWFRKNERRLNIIHHQCRGDQLTKRFKAYKRVLREDFKNYPKV